MEHQRSGDDQLISLHCQILRGKSIGVLLVVVFFLLANSPNNGGKEKKRGEERRKGEGKNKEGERRRGVRNLFREEFGAKIASEEAGVCHNTSEHGNVVVHSDYSKRVQRPHHILHRFHSIHSSCCYLRHFLSPLSVKYLIIIIINFYII